MSGFSAELIDYLEGRITFEEFDKRREQRETEESKRQSSGNGEGEEATADAQPTTSGQSLGNTGNVEEGVSPVVQQAFASMLEDSIQQQPSSSSDEEGEGEGNVSDSMSYVDDEKDEDYKEKEVVCKAKKQGGRSRRRKKKKEEEEEMLDEMLEEREQGAEKPSVGDVFALEMELNRENRKMMKERRHRSKLPRALRGLMGEANIRYARGEKDDAILMCMEIIRQAPLAYEPFSTLAMIYEDNEDVDKALQFGLIAAHLNPSDCEEWVKLAEMSLEQGNTRQAVVCYGKAIKYDPSNVRFLWERSNLYMQLGEHKQCMDGYRRILSLLPMESGQDFIQLSKDMAKSYYESNDLPSALGVMEEALARHPDLITHELTNMAAELFIANHQHSKAMKILVQFCGIVLVRDDVRTTDAPSVQMEQMSMKEEEKEKEKEEEAAKEEEKKGEEQEEEEKKKENEATESTTEEVVKEELLGEIKEVEIEDSVPVDIRAKLMVCLIHQQIFKPLEALLTEMMEQSPEEVGDLYLDVAEAYLDQGQYTSALPLLSALVTSEKYNLAVVWLRHAECLKALGHIDNAAESYNRVVLMAPQHLEARLCLSTLHQQLGRPDMALKALEPMYDPDTLAQDSSATQQELKLLLQRSTLLQTQGKVQENIDTMLTMLAMLLKVAMQRARVCARLVSECGQRHMKLVKLKSVLSDIEDPEAAYQDIMGKASVLSREDWWQLVCRCVCVLCDVQRYKEAELLVDSSMEFVVFYENKAKRKELEFFGLSAAFLDKNYRRAYDYIRLMLMDNAERPQLWNIFNQVTMNSQDQRHHRFCLRLMLKNPENLALCVLCGHNALVSGSFKHALGQYMQAFRTDSNNPLHSLYVGITFFHMASQKFVAKRHPLLVQGFSFLWRYVELRGECQESMYNLGRALHQVGLVHLALHYYHKALSLPAPTLEGISCDQVDLRGEIAFNLSLIYRASGNTEIARQLITTHCII